LERERERERGASWGSELEREGDELGICGGGFEISRYFWSG
jgi:hypothetical protein